MTTSRGKGAGPGVEIVRVRLAGEEGHSNAEIARARGTSARTVANQLAGLFRKLGVQ